MAVKYVFVTGGVVSGLGKESQQLLLGVCSRHAGTQLQCRNLIRTSTLTRVQ